MVIRFANLHTYKIVELIMMASHPEEVNNLPKTKLPVISTTASNHKILLNKLINSYLSTRKIKKSHLWEDNLPSVKQSFYLNLFNLRENFPIKVGYLKLFFYLKTLFAFDYSQIFNYFDDKFKNKTRTSSFLPFIIFLFFTTLFS